MVDRVERRLKMVAQGDLAIPPDADPITILLSDGKLTQPVAISVGITLGDLRQQYLDALPPGSLHSLPHFTDIAQNNEAVGSMPLKHVDGFTKLVILFVNVSQDAKFHGLFPFGFVIITRAAIYRVCWPARLDLLLAPKRSASHHRSNSCLCT